MSSRHCPTACVMRTSPWRLRSHVAVSGPRPNTLRIREQILASFHDQGIDLSQIGSQQALQTIKLQVAHVLGC